MIFDPDQEDLLQRANGVVVIMAGDFLVQLGGPFLAGDVRDFIEPQLQDLRPGRLQFLKAPQPVALTLRFQRGVTFELLFEPHHGFREQRRNNSLTVYLLLFKEIVEP